VARVPITLPDLGAGAVLSLWYVRPGDPVFEGDRVAEVLLPGATFDVPAPATGVLVERLALTNDPVAAGQVLGTISEDSATDEHG
jgi:pyruvate/2-oxoglutarate dehydrogenase complex dihydrolipoamide acyltransferase (E2) component